MIYDTDKNLKFIDFESCGISDPAYDIADIFTGFGKKFTKEHQDLFYKEYLKYRKDNSLKNRVKVFIPLKMFETFCWSVMHVYEIKAGIVSKDIQEKEPIQHHIDYALKCLKECKKLGLVSNNKINLFEDLLDAGGKKHHTFGSTAKSLMLGDAWWVSYHKKRSQRGIKAKLLFNESLAHWKAETKYPKSEVKYTKAGFEPLTETIIRNDKIGIIIWSDKPLGIIIHQKVAAQSYDQFFKIMWNSATK